jgi:phosphoenolpyruvate carboxykinase (ATP)
MPLINKNYNIKSLIELSCVNEGSIVNNAGALCTLTGACTGRSPNAKSIVYDSISKDTVDWTNNNKIGEDKFDELYNQFLKYKNSLACVYLQEVSAVKDKDYALTINVWTEFAKHSMFARNMFVPHSDKDFKAVYNIYHFPTFSDEPTVIISLKERIILITGTLYSGEIKKSIFTVLNFWFPEDYDFLPMHCSVNTDRSGTNPAIFFGLSGTGKTTLSSDENRILIGDDEHGWTDKGLVNFENGCYAKTINLSKEDEPQIWSACNRRGTLLENVVINDGTPDFDDARHTQNGRASYPFSFIKNSSKTGYVNEHPKNIIMLTCDSFGVLPSVAKLTPDEAVEQFLLGYTSKVAGTEAGITKPVATFSPCFGLPFMPLPPARYGALLKAKIAEHNVNCWLVNTGWTGGGYGVGKRTPISITRMIIDKILDGSLAKCVTIIHHPTGLTLPVNSEIPRDILVPQLGWTSREDYESAATKLKAKFELQKRAIK